MSEADPIEQVTLDRLLADPATSFALKAVIRVWSDRDVVDAANDAWLLSAAFSWEAACQVGVA